MRSGLLGVILGGSSAAACTAPAPPPTAARPRVVATAPAPLPIPAELEAAAAAYRAQRDLSRLEDVFALLEPGMARADVERLLGEPDGWDDPTVFYGSDRANRAGDRLGMSLDFYLWYADGRPSTRSDRLERAVLGSGNRFESPDPRIPRRRDPAAASGRAALDAASAHYRQHRDYASLRALVRGLRLGTSRADVERLLGAPDHCSVEGLPCYYATERTNAAGLPLGVMVEYRVHNVGGTELVRTDRLEAVARGPVPKD